ncbi:SidA/IucD/PvdA family monooxygenase [Pedobacter sp. MR2016-19]|uniref:lysine N(6)-hydroxylase/L-ornithine N(5)-oxygenase family protein n=1 Tax=Pedobacter sp. MR2016-19 TaxID=2780089 RepID=UPI001874BE0C|nr:SidA/IucD/PvdA family monooxygenase [Pedobacter sp. MR2016-19]MBE5320299.1 SidA/IucD/PvdA family monooxygenase [Pedobacter sp. MR2016-19]
MQEQKIYDIVGIGIGPFNLGLAALCAPINSLSTLFLDQAKEFNWHPGMMLSDATLQVPFMADLVTMADPTSPYSFLNYLKQTDRLYKFYIREDFFVLRKEYNAYCKWAINHLPNCQFGQKVTSINYIDGIYQIEKIDQVNGTTETILAKKIVLGTGTAPKVPTFVNPTIHKHAIHSSEYLKFKQTLLKQKTVAIIGSGQSAAEIFYDLLPETENGLNLKWFTRPDRFFPMEYSKLTLELTSPEYVDHFYNLSESKRKQLLSKQNSLFKGINFELINQIFDKLYELSVDGEEINAELMPNCQLNNLTVNNDSSYQLDFYHTESEKDFTVDTDALILATGYKYNEPGFLSAINDRIARNADGLFQVHRNYAIDVNGNEIFVQNAELHTHGFVTPDLGMGAYRNASIINAILGFEIYPVEKRIAFQQFSVNGEQEVLEQAQDFIRDCHVEPVETP